MHLLACKSCGRQYDVTHLDIDATVRCQCDTLLVVPPPRKVVVSALLCSHCGGPVGLDDEACPYCAAKISERDRRESTLCPACYARISAEARHCAGCGLRIRPTALRPLPSERGCPRCAGALRHRALGETNLVECADCGGLWVRPEVFEELCHAAVTRSALPAPIPAAATPDGAALQARITDELRYIACVDCGELMIRRQFSHHDLPSGVIIDVCRHHGVWLDDEELAKISEFLARSGRARLLGRPALSGPRRDPSAADAALAQALAAEKRERGFVGQAGEALVETFELLGKILGYRL